MMSYILNQILRQGNAAILVNFLLRALKLGTLIVSHATHLWL